MEHVQCLIVGAGAAGMACAFGVYEQGCKDILVIDRDKEAGGILNQCIHNGFGLHTFHEELSGPSYAEIYYEKIKDIPEIKILFESVIVKITEDKQVHVINEKGYTVYQCDSIVLASGSMERSAASIHLKGDRCQGIYTAGSAQHFLNKEGYLVGKKVFILGSGDIGLIMARRMTLEGAKVIGVAEIMPYSNGLARNIKQCLEDFDIPLYLSSTITRTIGKSRLEAIELAQVDENRQVIEGTRRLINVDCLLLSVGLNPEDTLLEKLDIEFDKGTRAVKVNEQYMTSMPGIFACGNALHVHDLVDFVSEESYACGQAVGQYLQDSLVHDSTLTHEISKDFGYILPQRVSKQQDVTFSFRVRNIFKKAKVHVYSKDLDKTIPFVSLVPSEMAKVKLTKADLEKADDVLHWEVIE